MNEPILYTDKGGNSYSAYPPTTYLTFAYWIYMVPQFRPESVLILGYGGGTIAGLIRLLYGQVAITGVDIEPVENPYGAEIVQADAREFLKTCGHYDAVIVDLFRREDSEPCTFILEPEFVAALSRVANYIIVNTLRDADMKAYSGLRKIGMNKPTGSAEKIYYYEVKKIPHLHPYK